MGKSGKYLQWLGFFFALFLFAVDLGLLGMIVIVLLFASRLNGPAVQEWRREMALKLQDPKVWFYSLILGYLACLACSCASLFFDGLIGHVSPVYAQWATSKMRYINDNLTGFANVFEGAIIAPILEEFLFRGLILRVVGHRLGLRIGIVISSVLFGIMHFTHPFGGILAGFVFATLMVRTGTIVAPIVVHMLSNGIAFFLVANHPSNHDNNHLYTPLENTQEVLQSMGVAFVALLYLYFFFRHKLPYSNFRTKASNP